jgi:hypothetical protein
LVGIREDTVNVLPGVEYGNISVEINIREISKELSRAVDCLEWPRPGDPTIARSFKAGTIPLRIWHGGEFQMVEFLETELEDVEATPEMQERLEERIREGLSTGA